MGTDHHRPGPCCFPMTPFSRAWTWLGERKAHFSGHPQLSKSSMGIEAHEEHLWRIQDPFLDFSGSPLQRTGKGDQEPQPPQQPLPPWLNCSTGSGRRHPSPRAAEQIGTSEPA